MNNSPFKKYINEYAAEIGREILLFTFIEVPMRAAGLSYSAGKYISNKSKKVYNKEGGIEYYKISLAEILNLIRAKSSDCNAEQNLIMREYCILKSMNNQLKSMNSLRSTCKYANDINGCNTKITQSIIKLKEDIYKQQEKINKLEVNKIQLDANRI